MTAHIPIVTGAKLIRALKRGGYELDHQTGSHVFLSHPKAPKRIVCVPNHNKDLKKGTLKSILRQAQMTEEELIVLL